MERYRVGSRASPWRVWQAHTLRLIPPGVTYWELCRIRKGQPLSEVAFVNFLGGKEAGLDKLIQPHAGYALFLDPAEMARLGHELGEEGFWPTQSLFCALLGWLLKSEPVEGEIRRIGHSAPAKATAASDFVQAANAYMEEHLGKPVQLAEMAKHLRVSVSALSHRYRKQMGVAPMAHLQHLRIRHAKTMLLAGHKLRTVAQALHFSDSCHLSRTCKQVEGASPRDFLAAMRRSDPLTR